MKNELNKLLENRIYNHEECVSKIEDLANEFAIGFAEWYDHLSEEKWICHTSQQLLEIYKKEKKL